MKKKKVLITILILLSLFVITGCFGKNDDTKESSPPNDLDYNQVWINGEIVTLGITVREFMDRTRLEYITTHMSWSMDKGLDETFSNPGWGSRRHIPIGINEDWYFTLMVHPDNDTQKPLWDHRIRMITAHTPYEKPPIGAVFAFGLSPGKSMPSDIIKALGEPDEHDPYVGDRTYYNRGNIQIQIIYDANVDNIGTIGISEE